MFSTLLNGLQVFQQSVPSYTTSCNTQHSATTRSSSRILFMRGFTVLRRVVSARANTCARACTTGVTAHLFHEFFRPWDRRTSRDEPTIAEVTLDDILVVDAVHEQLGIFVQLLRCQVGGVTLTANCRQLLFIKLYLQNDGFEAISIILMIYFTVSINRDVLSS